MLCAMTNEVPLRRESLSEQVFARLRDRLLSGELAPGAALPPERELVAQFGVNRHAIREALKRLQQARLIEISHGGRTTALDWRRTAGLDLVVSLPGAGRVLTLDSAQRDTLEMRACIGSDAARLCALRRRQGDADSPGLRANMPRSGHKSSSRSTRRGRGGT